MKSYVTRIDYSKQSFCISLTSIVYIRFFELVNGTPAKLFIKLSFGESIEITEFNAELAQELKEIYLDLFTKWKSANMIDEKDEDGLLVFEAY